MIKVEFHISNASSPGHAKSNTKKGSSRNHWFTPRGLEDLPERNHLFSNDTSIGCGFYPLHHLEQFALDLEKSLTIGEFGKKHKWCGTDVKIMGSHIDEKTDITICVPQIAHYVNSLDEYIENIGAVRKHIQDFAKEHYKYENVTFNINTRDEYDTEELYLTATGSSIESGDEGLVGRGNRVNQIISINHPMSMEGASGKNPVYHIGKLYYIAAHKISRLIYEEFCISNEVYLVSQSGRTLVDPWKVVVRIDEVEAIHHNIAQIEEFVATQLKVIPAITKELVDGEIVIA